MILHLRQIFFTDASTFICLSDTVAHLASNGAPVKSPQGLSSVPCYLTSDTYFALNVIRARDRSYGVNSTVTLSPGRILM